MLGWQTVQWLMNHRPDLEFYSDKRSVDIIKNTVGALAKGYDSFFVQIGYDEGEPEFVEVWGMVGKKPYPEKGVYRLIPENDE